MSTHRLSDDPGVGEDATLSVLVEAEAALSAARYDEAVALANRGIESNPLGFNFVRIRAQAEYHRSRFKEAIADAETVLSIVPHDAFMAQTLLFSAIFSGDFDEAKRAAREGLKHHPDHLAFLHFACKTAQSDGDAELALRLARRLLVLHGEFSEVQSLAADCLMAAGLAREARVHLEKSIELGSRDHSVFYHLGCIDLGDKKFDPALGHFLDSIDAGRQSADARIGAAYCYLGLAEPMKARDMCDQAFAIGPVDLRAWELKLCVASAMSDDVGARAAAAEIDKARANAGMAPLAG